MLQKLLHLLVINQILKNTGDGWSIGKRRYEIRYVADSVYTLPFTRIPVVVTPVEFSYAGTRQE